MTIPPAPFDVWHVVINDEGCRSLWPDYRRNALPAGWNWAGISGSRAECLKKIAAASPVTEIHRRTTHRATDANAKATTSPFPRPDAPGRLIIFPHAGSGASYYHFLARALKDEPVEVHIVQYRGREMRMKEAPLTSMGEMIEVLTEELNPLLSEKPVTFFGHSMGALAAFELARTLTATGGPLPRHLFLSGRQPPQIPGPVLDVDRLDDAAFLDAVGRRYKALPPELLANREILEIVLPSLRADFTLMERYTYRDAPPLDVPFTLLNGVEDPWVQSDALDEWQRHTRHPLQQRSFPGGHFYLSAAVGDLKAAILATVASNRPTGPASGQE